MKKSIKILIGIACIVSSIQVGFIAGILTFIGVGIRQTLTPKSFDITKEGGFIFSDSTNSYCIKNDFSMRINYSKDYVSNTFLKFSYIYGDNGSQITSDDNLTVSFNDLKDQLDKKNSFFNNSSIYQIDDIIFISSDVTNQFGNTMLFYFDGTNIQYVFEIEKQPITKIKILETFIK